MFGINEFKSKNKISFLKPTKFEFALLSVPTVLRNAGWQQNDLNHFRFLCEGSVLPGVGLNTHQVRRYGYGIEETKPVFPIFQKLNLSFLADGNGNVWKFFKDWSHGIVNFKNDKNDLTVQTSADRGNQLAVYEMSYREDYQCDVEIVQYDDEGNAVIRVQMLRAYPIAVNDTPVNWSQTGQVHRINVVFSYLDWIEV